MFIVPWLRQLLLKWVSISLCILGLIGGVFSASFVWASAASTQTWVVLGDSISAGYGIPAGQGWVDLLQANLQREGRNIILKNESISGDTTAGGLARLPGIIDRLNPQLVIIELGGNDGLRGLSTKAMERNLKAMIELCEQRSVNVVVFGMKIPPNYGRKYAELFEQAYVSAAQASSTPLMPFFLEGIGGYEVLMQGDRVHPNLEAQSVLLNNALGFLSELKL